jgi:hypothetical protein
LAGLSDLDEQLKWNVAHIFVRWHEIDRAGGSIEIGKQRGFIAHEVARFYCGCSPTWLLFSFRPRGAGLLPTWGVPLTRNG